MSRIPLDTWTKREQLCLATAVSCSGDQNWITVSRTLKSVCGNGNARPADWYSQKNCAVQYAHLLETVETTKRKKRTSENSGFSSPATVVVETPTEILLRRLTEERMQEIKTQMRRDQELYLKVHREIEALQSNDLSEQQLQSMWQEIEKEQETKRIEEMKLENRMREREQRKKENAGNWRNSNSVTGRRSNLAADTTSVDMDVEDIAGTTSAPANNKQQAIPAPLLTSLLKSPGGSSNNANNAISPTGTAPSPGVARATATAPTITSLLTSGTSAMPNQPAVILKSPNDPEFMTRPISGPPVAEAITTGRSPSQAAPTLSMLLEKNKGGPAATGTKLSETPTKHADAEIPPSDKQAAADLEAIFTDDPMEQHLLEVFCKNIIDDIEIDEILKDVDDVVLPNAPPAKADEDDLEVKKDTSKNADLEGRKSNDSPSQSKTQEVVIGSSDDSNDNIPLAAVASQETKDRSQSSTEPPEAATEEAEMVTEELNESITIASSSSEENARTEQPTPSIADAVEAPETAKNKSAAPTTEGNASDSTKQSEETSTLEQTDSKPEQKEASSEVPKEEPSKAGSSAATKVDSDASGDMKTSAATGASSVHDTDEESSSLTDSSKAEEPTRNAKVKQHTEGKSADMEISNVARQTPPRTSTSSSGSITCAPGPVPAVVSARPPLLRKLPHRDRSESPMVDDDTTTASDHSTARSSTRRRCSSTPVIDSIPNSPASSEHTDDRRETRGASRKLFLSIYNTLVESKYSAPFRRAFHDEHPRQQTELCLRPMDLPTIKRNIDSGHLRSISELQRDVLLMCQNLSLIYKPHTTQNKTALLFMQECRAHKEFAAISQAPSDNSSSASSSVGNKADKEKDKDKDKDREKEKDKDKERDKEKEKEKEKERTPAGNKVRSGFRKSQRHH